MRIHRSDLEHGNVIRAVKLAVVARQLGVADRTVVSHASVYHLALDTGHMPGVPAEMLTCILTCKNSQRLHQDTAAQLDVCQFVGALCESLIQCVNGVGAPAVIYPVSGFDELYRLICGDKLLFVFFTKIHLKYLPHKRLLKFYHSFILSLYVVFYKPCRSVFPEICKIRSPPASASLWKPPGICRASFHTGW